jgi:hypothetical protein
MRVPASLLAWMVACTLHAAPAAASPQARPLTFVDLSYPSDALAARTDGVVIVQVKTDSSGRIVEAESLVGPLMLARAVVANVKGWTLGPGPATDWLVFRFEIESGRCNDDGHSLFRLVHWNLAVVTACTAPGRGFARRPPEDPLSLRSMGSTPLYPQIAQSANARGVAILELTVDIDGTVTAARALNNLPLLAPVAVAHAKTWRVWPGPPGRRFAVYEFTLENFVCEPESSTFLTRVEANYLRLTGCTPVVQAATRRGA